MGLLLDDIKEDSAHKYNFNESGRPKLSWTQVIAKQREDEEH